jgi:hypothetical protein
VCTSFVKSSTIHLEYKLCSKKFETLKILYIYFFPCHVIDFLTFIFEKKNCTRHRRLPDTEVCDDTWATECFVLEGENERSTF